MKQRGHREEQYLAVQAEYGTDPLCEAIQIVPTEPHDACSPILSNVADKYAYVQVRDIDRMEREREREDSEKEGEKERWRKVPKFNTFESHAAHQCEHNKLM